MNLSIVIPLRDTDEPYTTVGSIDVPCEIIVARDNGKGANHARNRGWKRVRTEFVLFSDGDIEWKPGGIASMLTALEANPVASYAYGSYEMGGKVIGAVEFDPARLRKNNYISTMAVIRAEKFPGFDENIQRLQDWDLWLTMLARGGHGVYCGQTVFSTERREGITTGEGISWVEARAVVAEKHGL